MRSSTTDTSSTFTEESPDPESNTAVRGQMQGLIPTLITLLQRLEYRFLNQEVSMVSFKVKTLKVDARRSTLALLERR